MTQVKEEVLPWILDFKDFLAWVDQNQLEWVCLKKNKNKMTENINNKTQVSQII